MSDPRLVNLVQKIYARTDTGNVSWEETDTEGVYQVTFHEYTLRLWMQFQDGPIPGTEYYVLSIFNTRGLKIEEVSDTDLSQDLSDSYEAMKHLYRAARRKAMGVDQALDSILSALEEDALSS